LIARPITRLAACPADLEREVAEAGAIPAVLKALSGPRSASVVENAFALLWNLAADGAPARILPQRAGG
jgi:hypothetical protein